jgi:hypothetical protein
MRPSVARALVFIACCLHAFGQQPPYDLFPPADPPYFRVRYEGSSRPGELVFPANFTVWIPPGIKTLRGVIVHQHGCGEGSCKSGLTGAYDLHWQALARKHHCALLAPAYEQPESANCQLWCDPRNGSDAVFQRALAELGTRSGHAELSRVPWALWGHSGGGYWAGGMTLLHPDRVVAAWLRSGVPPLQSTQGRPAPYSIPNDALQVPLMANLGTKEGFTETTNRFAGVWTGTKTFFETLRTRGGLIGIAIDPLTSHECGNQRYLAIPWLDACLKARLPAKAGAPLKPMPASAAWLVALQQPGAPIPDPVPAKAFPGALEQSVWLPNRQIARAWKHYATDTAVPDVSRPPAPRNLRVQGNVLTWDVDADPESGLAGFLIERDGRQIATLPEQATNPYGRPVFQKLQYSDTPPQPLAPLRFSDTTAAPGVTHRYRVIAVNTAGQRSR